MIDTHAHIYLPEFENDRMEIVEKAKKAGVEKILLPAIDSSTHEAMLKAEHQYIECTAMMGLHPCSVKENYNDELSIVAHLVGERDFIAIGEIGLDFYWDKTFIEQQYAAFHSQVELALQHSWPVVIHSRNATDECISVIEQYPGLTGVFHCFSGNVEQAEKLSNLGFMLGIGGVLTFKNAGLDKVIAATGTNNVVLETDSPYLAPVPFRGKRNEPSYTRVVAEKLSAVTNNTVDEVEDITNRNAIRLFKL